MMNKFLIVSIMVLNIACSNGQKTIKESAQVMVTEEVGEPYSILLTIEEENDSTFYLHSTLKIDSLSYMASTVNTTMSGIFKVNLIENSFINSTHDLIEKACPVVTNFVWSNSPQKVIMGKVEYIQKLTLNTQNEFTAKGEVQFVIEPRCTLEKIPFTLTFQNGNLSVKKN